MKSHLLLNAIPYSKLPNNPVSITCVHEPDDCYHVELYYWMAHGPHICLGCLEGFVYQSQLVLDYVKAYHESDAAETPITPNEFYDFGSNAASTYELDYDDSDFYGGTPGADPDDYDG